MDIHLLLSQIVSKGFGPVGAHGIAVHAQSVDPGAMEPDAFLRYLQNADFAAMLRQILESCGLAGAAALTLPVIILLGILWCFFGLKLIRIWSAITGLAVGLAIGLWDAEIFGLETSTGWVLGIILGGLLALIAVRLYLAGVFLAAWCAGSILAAAFLHPADWIKALICVGIGLLIALVALRFAEITTILLTAALGGACAVSGIAVLIPSAGRTARITMTVLLAAAGIAVQSVMEYKKRKKMARDQIGKAQGEENGVAGEAEPSLAPEIVSAEAGATAAPKAVSAEAGATAAPKAVSDEARPAAAMDVVSAEPGAVQTEPGLSIEPGAAQAEPGLSIEPGVAQAEPEQFS